MTAENDELEVISRTIFEGDGLLFSFDAIGQALIVVTETRISAEKCWGLFFDLELEKNQKLTEWVKKRWCHGIIIEIFEGKVGDEIQEAAFLRSKEKPEDVLYFNIKGISPVEQKIQRKTSLPL